MGGVEIYKIQDSADPGYRTVFYRYKELKDLIGKDGETAEPFARGPNGMKGVRLVELEPNRIGVFTRPQGKDFGGRGRIGYYEISSLYDLESSLTQYMQDKNISTLISGLFVSEEYGSEEWGGANQVTLMADGKIFVLGHIAGFLGQSRIKAYFPMTFIFDPLTHKFTDYQIISSKREYPLQSSKFKSIGIVYYPAGFAKIHNKLMLIAGLGDCAIGAQKAR